MHQISPRRAVFHLALFVLLGAATAAAPLSFVPQRLVQPDGSVLLCYASGDEHYNWLHDKNGYTIIQDEMSGWYTYALKRDGRLVPSGAVAGVQDPAVLGVEPWLKFDASRMNGIAGFAKRGGDTPIIAAPTKGRLNNIVVFIRFSDEQEWKDSIEYYNAQYNKPAANSMRAYFEEVSYGQLTVSTTFYPVPTGATVLSYQDSLPRARYMPYNATTNPTGYTNAGALEQNLVGGAMKYIASQIPDTLAVDGDKDGFIDNVSFIISGTPTAWATLLWPHATSYGGPAITINGARLRTYNLLLQSFYANYAGVSVVCHEMFHSLGGPDLYHYNHDGLQPAGSWDLMEANANPPQHMTAYMKWKYGKWIASIPEIRTPGTYTVSPLTSPTNNCYKIPSPYSTTEYFVVEYRRKGGLFEAAIPGTGLLVYRINTVYRGNASGPPDELYIYRPGGTLKANGQPAQAFYSATAGRTAINDITSPSSFLTNGNRGGLNLFNVGTPGGTISFDVGLDTLLVQITSPVAGSQLVAGAKKKIGWLSFGMQRTLRVEYSTNKGVTWSTIDGAARNALYWTVPDTPSRFCRMRITDAANPSVRDSCSFAICPPFYPIQFNYDVTDTTKARDNTGIVFLNGQFWTSRASSDALMNWTRDGDMVGEFYISGAVGIKSMAFDGSTVYAATGSDRLPKIHPITRNRFGQIMAPVRADFISYDPTADAGKGGLWIGTQGSDLVLISLQGTELRRIDSAVHGIDNIIGIACDAFSTGDPYLWVFSKGSGPGQPQYLHRLSALDGRHSGVFHDVLQDIGHTSVDGLAGGLCIAVDVVTGTRSLCGTLLGTPNRLFGYELPQAGSALLFEENFPYPPGGSVSLHGWTALFGGGAPSITISDEGLFYPSYIGSNIGRAAQITGNSGPAQGAAHSFSSVTDGSVYMAAMLRVTSADNSSRSVLALDATPESVGLPVQVFVAESGGKLSFGAGLPYPDASPQIRSGYTFEKDSTYLIVVKTSVGPDDADTLAMWVNPPVGPFEPEPDLIQILPRVAPLEIGAVKLLALDRGVSGATADGIRIATRWDEAVRRRVERFSRAVVVIDATDEKSAPFKELGINDSTVDALYRSAFQPSGEWDMQVYGTPKLEYLLLHRFVVIHGDHCATQVPHAVSRIEITDVLEEYMDAGGTLLVSGWRALPSFDWGKPFPRAFAQGTFAREYLGLAGIDESVADTGDFVRADGRAPFTAVSVDTGKISPAPYNGRLTQITTMTGVPVNTSILYTYANDPASAFPAYRGAAVGLRHVTPASAAYVLGFPLYFLKETDAARLAYEILQDAGVSRVPLDVAPVRAAPSTAYLGPNYPNPVAGHTTLPYALATRSTVRLAVYDLHGRLVTTLDERTAEAGTYLAHWRANVPSGMYLAVLDVVPSDGTTPQRSQRLIPVRR
ncbi:MAG: M6 family metalloprotease domain-containing protein [Ignavibacteriae bacterium]|nr:M6 family metalloprotease domain-containing protein [Ignavibacteriota bacterium]